MALHQQLYKETPCKSTKCCLVEWYTSLIPAAALTVRCLPMEAKCLSTGLVDSSNVCTQHLKVTS